MLFWFFNAIFWSVASVLYKKALELTNGVLSSKLYQFVGAIVTLSLWIIGYFFIDIEIMWWGIAGLLFISAIFGIFAEVFEQHAYKNEKLSTLLPYGEFETIFTVVFWFLLFTDSSFNSFIFTIIAWFILILWSIDFKKLSFNKYCGSLMIAALLWSIKVLIFWYILLELTPYNVFVYNTMMVLWILLVINILTKDMKNIKLLSPKMTLYIALENMLRFVIWIVSLFLIKELWIVQAVLIGMLFLVFSMISAFLFLKETPTKKEIFIVIWVCVCISCWVYFW
jgi:drug/metabolite transporter (DMT)-like permease